MKKIIAKEFLLFIVGIIFGIIFLGSVSLYKNYLINKDLKYGNELYSIGEKSNELLLKINESYYFRDSVYNFLKTYYGVNQMPSFEDFNKELNNKDYAIKIHENIEDLNKLIRNKEIKFIYPYYELPYNLKEFESKIIEKDTTKLSIDYDILNNKGDSLINKKVELTNYYFYKTSYYNIMLRYILFYFILIYILRYAIVGVRWSIKELKL
jgi:hypothetical protein